MSWLETRRPKNHINAYTESEFQLCSRSPTYTRGWVKTQQGTNDTLPRIVFELQCSLYSSPTPEEALHTTDGHFFFRNVQHIDIYTHTHPQNSYPKD